MDFVDRLIDSKYRIVRLIGEGGMGVVYEADHERLHRRLAVKFLAADLAGDPAAVARFHQEAEAAGRIGHDNICEVIDVGTTDDKVPYLVMPLLRGRALSDLIREVDRLPLERAADLVAQTLGALAAAHAVGIVHRDLKPENLFVTKIGDRDDFVKVLDFGISKVMRDPTLGGRQQSLTRTGSVLGTPTYMAPEQARGAKDIDARADIYALGVILYEMLTGRRPFEGDSFNEVLWKIWNDPVPPPRALRPDLPPAVEKVVLRAMARDREDRFASAQDFRNALADALQRARRGEDQPTDSRVTVESPAPTVRVTPRPEAEPTRDGVAGPATPAPRPAAPTLTPAAGTLDGRSLHDFAPHRRRSVVVFAAVVLALAVGATLLWVRGAGETPTSGDAASIAVDVVSVAQSLPSSPPAPDAAAALPTFSEADAASPTVAEVPAAPDAGDRVALPQPDAGFEAVPEAAPRLDLVRVRLRGVPADAVVLVDGTPVGGPTFDLARAEREADVVVRVEGFAEWVGKVSAMQDVDVDVDLRASAVDAGEPAEAGRPRRDGGTVRARDVGEVVRGERDAAAARDERSAPDGIVTTFGQVP